MNTIAHLCAMLALLWASLYAFRTLSENPLGLALLGLFFLWIPLTLVALDDDMMIIFGHGLPFGRKRG